MKRPQVGSDAGWPRPRQPTIPSLVDAALRGERGRPLPVPWIAKGAESEEGWMPAAYDSRRSQRVIREDLCQVCGGPRGDTVYGLVPAGDVSHAAGLGHYDHSGGALCSLRCARLTAAVCPHYRELSPINIWAVPHLGARTALNSTRELDDIVDITVPGAEHVATIGDPT